MDPQTASRTALATALMRSRFTEDALSRAIARGVRQYVLVGAGFDSYAMRRGPEAAGVTVIEIDHPATQAFKRNCMTASGTVAPDPVHYVAADLATLRAVSTVAAQGSEVVFSYIDQAYFDAQTEDQSAGAAELRAMVASVGEPFVSGFDPASPGAELGRVGYAVIEECSDVELLRRYDPTGANGLVVNNGLSRIAHLRVAA